MVKQKLKKLKTDKTPGMGGIHPSVLCELKEEVAESLADFINKTLPQEWKDAILTPIYKEGAKSTAENYQVMKDLVNNEVLSMNLL